MNRGERLSLRINHKHVRHSILLLQNTNDAFACDAPLRCSEQKAPFASELASGFPGNVCLDKLSERFDITSTGLTLVHLFNLQS